MDYTMSDVMTYINENDVKFIRLTFCDLTGNLKNISITPVSLEAAFNHGIAIDGEKIAGFSLPKGEKLLLFPDPNTIKVLPWRPQTGRVVRFYCNIKNKDKSDFLLDSRILLQKTIKQLKDMGITIKIATKSEFYLFKTDEDGNPTKIPFDTGGYLDVSPNDRGENVRREICLCLEDMGLNPKSSHHEVGPGQNEIDFKYDDALSAADSFLTFKSVVKAIAGRNGLYASFMPRPLLDSPGSGLLINISFFKNGKNIFNEDNNELSVLRENIIAGMLKYSIDCGLIYNPIINSYDRLGKSLAPLIAKCNRESLSSIKPTLDEGELSKIRFKQADCSINPYLAFYMILQSVIKGINQKLNNISPRELTTDFEKSMRIFQESEFIKSVVPNELINNYLSLKEDELNKIKKYETYEDFYFKGYFKYV